MKKIYRVGFSIYNSTYNQGFVVAENEDEAYRIAYATKEAGEALLGEEMLDDEIDETTIDIETTEETTLAKLTSELTVDDYEALEAELMAEIDKRVHEPAGLNKVSREYQPPSQ